MSSPTSSEKSRTGEIMYHGQMYAGIGRKFPDNSDGSTMVSKPVASRVVEAELIMKRAGMIGFIAMQTRLIGKVCYRTG